MEANFRFSPRYDFATRFAATLGDKFEGYSPIMLMQYLKQTDKAGIRLSLRQIILSSMHEFNDLLTEHNLTEEQANVCREIRRTAAAERNSNRHAWISGEQLARDIRMEMAMARHDQLKATIKKHREATKDTNEKK